MKTLKIFTAALLFVGLTASAYAQNPSNASINANAEVVSSFSFVTTSNLEFGSVLQGVNKTIAPATDDAGLFHILVPNGGKANLNFTAAPGDLVGTGGSSLPITWDVRYNSEDNLTGATTWENLEAGVNELEDENIYVFIGGTAEPANDQAIGTYALEITLQVEVN